MNVEVPTHSILTRHSGIVTDVPDTPDPLMSDLTRTLRSMTHRSHHSYTMTALIEHVPTEIWRAVLSIACTDGGYTGRSLALTSKFFHSQSLPARFRTVAFKSLQRLEDFLTYLDTQLRGFCPHIEHLYLSFEDEPVRRPRKIWRVYRALTPEQRREYDDRAQVERERWVARFGPATARILALAAPNLRTLCIAEVGLSPLHLDLPLSFPKLTELSWAGRILFLRPSGLATGPESDLDTPPATFPALKCVHIVGAEYSGTHLAEAISSIASLAVNTLVRLRISDLGEGDEPTLSALANILGVPFPPPPASGPVRPPGSSKNALLHLRRLVLHTAAPGFGGWCGFSDSQWEEFDDGLHAFALECGKHVDDLRVLPLSRDWRKNPRWPDRLHDNWIDRIEGRPGCWVKSQAAEDVALEAYEDDPRSPESIQEETMLPD
ncbi:hypothetical protein BD413DRAFT_255403 [Trametes elegans]|nr:hypothetical protein BD413DRAFT_255403 [Trametes elegans]